MNNQTTAESTSASTAEESSRRGANYTLYEDLQLYESWLSISQDLTRGREQHHLELWQRIKEDWETKLHIVLVII